MDDPLREHPVLPGVGRDSQQHSTVTAVLAGLKEVVPQGNH
jgi:hypothetical protein